MTMYETQPGEDVIVKLSGATHGTIAVQQQGKRMVVELSPGMAAALLAVLQRYADEGKINPQLYTSADVQSVRP